MSARRARAHTTARNFPRTARLNHLVQEIVADEIERLNDERLGLFTVVSVEVEPDLRRATVFYTSLSVGEAVPAEESEDVAAALAEHRTRLQAAIARQAHLKRTPELVFRPDTLIRQAERIEEIIREIADGA